MTRALAVGAALSLCIALLASCANAGDERAGARLEFADLRVGLVITTGGRGGDLAGPAIGATNVAKKHLSSKGAEITVEQLDYAGDLSIVARKPDGSPSDAVKELASKSDVVIVGTDDPAIVQALGDLDVPVLHAFVTKDGITGGDIFRLAPSDSMQAAVLAEFLVDHRKLTSIGLVYENSDFGSSGADAFEAAVVDAGGSIVSSEAFETGQDLHGPLAVAADEGAEAVAIWTDDPAEASRAVIDIHKSNFSYQVALPGNTAVPQFGKNAVAQVVPTAFREGILSVGPWAGPWLRSERIRRFYRDFEDVQNDLAPVRTAQVYDAVMIASAAKATGSIVGGMKQTRDFLGASVPVSFDGTQEGMDATDLWGWGFTKSKAGAGAEFFPAVDTGGGFFTLIPAGNRVPEKFRYMLP